MAHRPPAADGGYRNPVVVSSKLAAVIAVRFTFAEAEAIRIAAQRAGLSASEFLRKRLSGGLQAEA